MSKCTYDPKEMANQPIGMFHCPLCGEMVLAGLDHPEWDDVERKYQEYCDLKYKLMQDFFHIHLGKEGYHEFMMFIDKTPNMQGTLLELWLHADFNEDYLCMRCCKPTQKRTLYCSEFCEKSHEFEMNDRGVVQSGSTSGS